MDMQLVTDPYACMMYIVSPLARGGGILWCLFLSSAFQQVFELHISVYVLSGHSDAIPVISGR